MINNLIALDASIGKQVVLFKALSLDQNNLSVLYPKAFITSAFKVSDAISKAEAAAIDYGTVIELGFKNKVKTVFVKTAGKETRTYLGEPFKGGYRVATFIPPCKAEWSKAAACKLVPIMELLQKATRIGLKVSMMSPFLSPHIMFSEIGIYQFQPDTIAKVNYQPATYTPGSGQLIEMMGDSVVHQPDGYCSVILDEEGNPSILNHHYRTGEFNTLMLRKDGELIFFEEHIKTMERQLNN